MALGVVRTASFSLMAFGTAIAVQGPVLPGIRHDLHLGEFQSGVFVAVQGTGWGLGALLGGPLANRFGRRVGFVVGTALMTIGLAVEALAPAAIVVVTAVFVTTIGGGLITGSVNASLADRGPRALSLANAFFGVGAVAGPLLAAALIRSGLGWRAAPAVASAIMLTTLLLAGSIPQGTASHPAIRLGASGLLRSPVFLLLTCVLGLEIASEAGLIGWFPTYAVSARGFAPWAAAAAPVAFWGGTTIARLALGTRPGDVDPRRLLPILTLAGAASATGLLLLPGAALAIAMLGLAGLAAGAVFPLVVSAIAGAFPHDTNVATGIVFGTAGTFETIVPLVLGAASGAAGTTAAGMVVIAMTWAGSAALAAAFARRAPVPVVGRSM